MQVCNSYSSNYASHHGQLHKTTSLPAFQASDNSVSSSASSIESLEEGYWRSSTKWILRLRRKVKVSNGTLYLAVWYLWRLVRQGCVLNEDNYEKIAASLVLLSAKMN